MLHSSLLYYLRKNNITQVSVQSYTVTQCNLMLTGSKLATFLSTGQHARNLHTFVDRSRKLIPYLNTFNTLEMFPTYFYGNHSQFTVKLSCPHCLTTSITNQLHTTRWKDERTLYDKPHKLYCIQRNVLLVTSSLSLHKWRPNLAS